MYKTCCEFLDYSICNYIKSFLWFITNLFITAFLYNIMKEKGEITNAQYQ